MSEHILNEDFNWEWKGVFIGLKQKQSYFSTFNFQLANIYNWNMLWIPLWFL